MDTLDGVVAKAAGTASKKGAFLDWSPTGSRMPCIFGGVAWYLAVGKDPKMALLPFAILAVSAVISYERAKAESLGYDAKGGLMERAERLILLGVALLLHFILVPLLALSSPFRLSRPCSASSRSGARRPRSSPVRRAPRGLAARTSRVAAGRPGASRVRRALQAPVDDTEPLSEPAAATSRSGYQAAPGACHGTLTGSPCVAAGSPPSAGALSGTRQTLPTPGCE